MFSLFLAFIAAVILVLGLLHAITLTPELVAIAVLLLVAAVVLGNELVARRIR